MYTNYPSVSTYKVLYNNYTASCSINNFQHNLKVVARDEPPTSAKHVIVGIDSVGNANIVKLPRTRCLSS